MATTNGALRSRLRSRTGAVLTSFALLGGSVVGGVVLSSPAQAACR